MTAHQRDERRSTRRALRGQVHPRVTNLVLLGLMVLAFATGTLAFGIGTGAARWVVISHGALGVAVVVMAPWKRVIIRRGLVRRHRRGRLAALTLSVTVVVTLVAGFAHSAGVVSVGGRLTTMQVHVGAAVLAVAAAIGHVATRWVRPRQDDLSRRTLVRAAVLTVVAGGAWTMLEGGMRALHLPGAERRLSGSHERGTQRPAAMPVTQWLFDDVPDVDADVWRLTVRGGGRDRHLDLSSLRRLPASNRQVLLDCTGGWFATQDWTGVAIADLPGIDLAGADPADRDTALPDREIAGRSSATNAATRIVVRSATGYWRAFPLGDAAELLLAYDVAGSALSPGHGFPLRLVAPGRRGFWWVKWVDLVVVDDLPWWRQPPFPLQ